MEEKKERDYRIYVTDMLVAILQSQLREEIEVPRYITLIDTPTSEKEPPETAEDVIERISNNLLNMGE